ncbi:hypothetical protein J1N35_041008 [Gossypium stocksii]|uniref:Aminotransferase-like plant mobile domain-containing protein n=1 Tax=Gossypium stocksii TaxID=47602 RepID=A0A9D3ZIA3_9ROSI|nr:hypothetical protein J1N35_041008 [Gossypium stocksii]
MDEDRIIKTYIHNFSVRAPCVIEQYLKETRFLLMSRMLGGTKLEPALISALLETWRPKTHVFHLLCGEYMITLKDVTLQLSLPIDVSIVMEAGMQMQFSMEKQYEDEDNVGDEDGDQNQNGNEGGDRDGDDDDESKPKP